MDTESDRNRPDFYVSTGHLPPPDRVKTLVEEAYEQFKSNREGRTSSVYPSLANAPEDLFGMCVVGTDGRLYSTGDAGYEFPIMSVSKPFVFALVCEAMGAEAARDRIGVNATGLPFNSLEALERSVDGRTNPMVNPPEQLQQPASFRGRRTTRNGTSSRMACHALPAGPSP